jgi:hypothetical protein
MSGLQSTNNSQMAGHNRLYLPEARYGSLPTMAEDWRASVEQRTAQGSGHHRPDPVVTGRSECSVNRDRAVSDQLDIASASDRQYDLVS